MVQDLHAFPLILGILEACCLLPDVLTLQHRDETQLFRCLWCFLKCFELFRLLDECQHLFPGKRRFISLQLLCQKRVLFRRQTALWHRGQYCAMGIIQKILSDQFFKVTGLYIFLHLCIYIKPQIIKRTPGIIQPAVKYVQSIHQSLRICAVVCFTRLEFHRIDPSQQCLFINAMLCCLFQRLPDNLNKTRFIFRICIFRDDAVRWLQDTALI